jgi:PAS domain S-box-containing protein
MNRLQILYVEDDLAMISMFRMLESTLLKSYQFTFADTIAKGAQELKENSKKYNAIVSDYHLPDGDAKALFPMPCDLPMIVLTATYDVNLAVTLMKLGVDDFLVKDKDMQFLKLLPEKIKSVIDKKTAEVAAAQQERRFRDLFENSNDIILYLNEDGKIPYANHQLLEILHYDKKEIEQLTIFDILHTDDKEVFRKLLTSLSPGQKFDDRPIRIVTKLNKELIMESSVFKGWQSDDLFYTRAIFRDVTEKKNNEQMIRVQNFDLASKNRQINEAVAKLRRASISKKSAAIVVSIGFVLFLISDFWLQPILINYYGNSGYLWVFQTALVLLLKPIDMLIERWLLREKMKRVGLT